MHGVPNDAERCSVVSIRYVHLCIGLPWEYMPNRAAVFSQQINNYLTNQPTMFMLYARKHAAPQALSSTTIDTPSLIN